MRANSSERCRPDLFDRAEPVNPEGRGVPVQKVAGRVGDDHPVGHRVDHRSETSQPPFGLAAALPVRSSASARLGSVRSV